MLVFGQPFKFTVIVTELADAWCLCIQFGNEYTNNLFWLDTLCTLSPRKMISWTHTHLFLGCFSPYLCVRSITLCSLSLCSAAVDSHMMSSMLTWTPSKPSMFCSMALWNITGVDCTQMAVQESNICQRTCWKYSTLCCFHPSLVARSLVMHE